MRSVPSVPIVLLLCSACSDPFGHPGRLDGHWATAFVPSGAYIELSLAQSGSSISGTGHAYGLMSVLTSTYGISGRQTSSAFSLTLVPDTGATVTFAGNVVDDSALVGTWSAAGSAPFQRSFLRLSF